MPATFVHFYADGSVAWSVLPSRQGLLQPMYIHCQVLGLQSDAGNAVCQTLTHD